MTAREIIEDIDAKFAAIRKDMEAGAAEAALLHSLRNLNWHRLEVYRRLDDLGERPPQGWHPIVNIT